MDKPLLLVMQCKICINSMPYTFTYIAMFVITFIYYLASETLSKLLIILKMMRNIRKKIIISSH